MPYNNASYYTSTMKPYLDKLHSNSIQRIYPFAALRITTYKKQTYE